MTYVPQILRQSTPREEQLDEELRQLDRAIAETRDYAVDRLAALPICDGCLDKDSLRAVLDDVLRDHTHQFRRWNEEG